MEEDPKARRQREQRLPQPADYGGDVRGIAALLEAKPKAGAELELDVLGSTAAHTHRQPATSRPALSELAERACGAITVTIDERKENGHPSFLERPFFVVTPPGGVLRFAYSSPTADDSSAGVTRVNVGGA